MYNRRCKDRAVGQEPRIGHTQLQILGPVAGEIAGKGVENEFAGQDEPVFPRQGGHMGQFEADIAQACLVQSGHIKADHRYSELQRRALIGGQRNAEHAGKHRG